MSSQICVGQSIDWCGRDAESLVTEALLSDRRRIWLCSYHAPSHYSTRNSAKKGLHCKRPLSFNIKRTPQNLVPTPFRVPWPSWLQNNLPWIRCSRFQTEDNTVVYWQCYLKRECGWQMFHEGGCPLHKARGRAAPIRLNNHAVPSSVEIKRSCDFSELSSANSETELQYNYSTIIDQKQHTGHNETTVKCL